MTFNWDEVEWVEVGLIDEFQALQVLPNPTRIERLRIEHIREHLDNGDVTCTCYMDAPSKEAFEETLGVHVADWQWEWIKAIYDGRTELQAVQGRSGVRWFMVKPKKEEVDGCP